MINPDEVFDASTYPVTDFDTNEIVNVIDTVGDADIVGVKVRTTQLHSSPLITTFFAAKKDIVISGISL